MTRLSMIALAAGLSGLATAAMAQQTNQPPPPSGPYQAGPGRRPGPGYGQQPATQAQTEAPKAGEARGAPEAAPPGWGAPAAAHGLWLRRSVRRPVRRLRRLSVRRLRGGYPYGGWGGPYGGWGGPYGLGRSLWLRLPYGYGYGPWGDYYGYGYGRNRGGLSGMARSFFGGY